MNIDPKLMENCESPRYNTLKITTRELDLIFSDEDDFVGKNIYNEYQHVLNICTDNIYKILEEFIHANNLTEVYELFSGYGFRFIFNLEAPKLDSIGLTEEHPQRDLYSKIISIEIIENDKYDVMSDEYKIHFSHLATAEKGQIIL